MELFMSAWNCKWDLTVFRLAPSLHPGHSTNATGSATFVQPICRLMKPFPLLQRGTATTEDYTGPCEKHTSRHGQQSKLCHQLCHLARLVTWVRLEDVGCIEAHLRWLQFSRCLVWEGRLHQCQPQSQQLLQFCQSLCGPSRWQQPAQFLRQ